MLARAAVVIPSIAVAVTAVVLLGPGAARPAVGARLRGVPAQGSRVFALRLEGIKSAYGVDEGAALKGLQVEATSGGESLGTWTGETGTDGIAEVRVEAAAPVRGPLTLRVTRDGALLTEGTIPLHPLTPASITPGSMKGIVTAADPQGAPGGLGPAAGDLSIRVDAVRGVLAAPFPELVRVFIADKTNSRIGLRADLEVSAPGADIQADAGQTAASPLKLSTDAQGLAELTLKPLAHQVELTVLARAGSKSARWEGTLPVVPGATWIAPPKGTAGASMGEPLSLVSPSPRERAYLSFFSEEGRVFGAVAELHRDPQGFYRGEVSPVLPPAAKILFVSIAGDPLEQGAGTVAFPLRPTEGAVAPRPLELLLDGVPDALARERARAWAARRAGLMVVAAAAVLSMLLIVLRSRMAQQQLEAHLNASAGDDAPGAEGEDSPALSGADREKIINSAREYPVLRALVAVAVVGLCFAIVAAVATFR